MNIETKTYPGGTTATGLAPLPNDAPMQEFWVVIDKDGWPQYCAGWPHACHEHINEAIEAGDEDAGQWHVRRAILTPNA